MVYCLNLRIINVLNLPPQTKQVYNHLAARANPPSVTRLRKTRAVVKTDKVVTSQSVSKRALHISLGELSVQ